MENKLRPATKLLITGVSVFLLMLMISGYIGLYTLRNSYVKTSHYIEAVNLARESQAYFQNQFYLWNVIILQGEEFPEYRANYHSFTVYADKVQDSLFNLKLLCAGFRSIPEEISSLRSLHKQITLEYLTLLPDFSDPESRNKKEILSSSKEKNDMAVSRMDKLVSNIEDYAASEIKRVNNYYFRLVFIALLLISASVVSLGILLIRKILNIHRELEDRISERTADLIKANADLTAEIEERIKAAEKLEKANKEIEDANIRIGLSEKKYRMLVDNSSDIIFSLNENWDFINANRAINTHLKINQEDVKTLNLLKLLYNGSGGKGFTNQAVREKLDNFSKDKKPVNFIWQLTSSFASEPKEMNVKLDYINVEGTYEIHGVISPLIEDTLLKYFVSERQRFEIGNYLTAIDDVTYTMVKNLKKFMDQSDISFLRIGLREMIVNSIEHGNLEIGYKEKTEALMNDTYRELIEERRKIPGNENKKVIIEYQVDRERAVFKITDSGKGFDYKKALSKDSTEENIEGIPHGRGILMTKEIFTEIRYNESGNQVLLIKQF